jgi:hypothetical protein
MLRVMGVLALSVVVQASAQTPMPAGPATPACTGDIVTVRRIEIKPPATLEKYLQTMDVHRAWYRSHGFKNNEIFAAKIVVKDPSSGAASYSTSELIAYHIRPPYGPNTTNVHDPAWIAFHKTYGEISRIKDQYQVCVPKDHGG